MSDILKELFNSPFYDDRDDRKLPEKLQTLRDQEIDLWERLQPILSPKDINEIENTQNAITYELNLHWFREGFRLGAGLILELL